MRWLITTLRAGWSRLSGWIARTWAWLKDSKEQLTILFTVIAAVYALREYQASQTDANIKRTLDFQARFSEKEFLSARTNLDNVLFDPHFDDKLAKTRLKGNEAMSKLILDAKLDPSVRLLADFYGQVATCMMNSLCDIKTACAVFDQPVKEFRNNYYGLFQRWEKTWNSNMMEPTFKYFESECKKDTSWWGTIARWFR
jgi:hypothetical protein